MAFAVLGKKPSEDDANYWKVLLSDQKIYNLNLEYGIGTSDIDLSGASIKNLKVKSGRADILINYNQMEPNQIEMDTFLVNVDFGSVEAKDLDHAKAKYIKAEIGFGSASLDFTHPLGNKCDVYANVGAGNLEVFLPRDEPVIINLKDSPLCALKLAKGFEETEDDVYVNRSYDSNADNLLTLNIDVAVGNIIFRYSK